MKQSAVYNRSLLTDIIPFWVKHSPDYDNGGYFTCLNENGSVYDTDKFVWLQARQVWTFSMLYNNVDQKDEWLNIATVGAEFLKKHCMDSAGNFYFALNKKGVPLTQPYNIFSDCFAAMAFSQYAEATQLNEYKELAKATYQNILARKENPKGIYEKSTGNRPLKGFALPMILANLVLELENTLTKEEVEKTIAYSVHEVMNVFLQDSGFIHEYVSPKGELINSFDGRLINPGHGIEAMWFMIDIAVRQNDQSLLKKAIATILNTLEFGWDKQYGGIFYFLDSKGHPPQQLEWDQKLWWVHLETLVALSKAGLHQPSEKISHWQQKVNDYTWNRFPDQNHGEWYGYLKRDGSPLTTLKGGKWKGCFHVPRAMYQCWQTFEKIEKNQIDQLQKN